MLLIILGILLTLIVLNWFPPKQIREGATTYQSYDENSCVSLAKQNQTNIESLQADMKKLLELQELVKVAQNTNDGNSKQLSGLTDQVFKTQN